LGRKRHLALLDFGGGAGSHYYDIRPYLAENISLKWYVVETPTMVKHCKKKGLENKELRFVDSISGLKDISFDLVYASGALQYVKNPYKTLKEIISWRVPFILFNRMMLNDGDKDLITVQRSLLSWHGPKAKLNSADKVIAFPHTTMSLKRFGKVVSMKYRLVWNIDETTGKFPISNNVILGKCFLYELIS